jgi:acetyl esterase/lipase
VFYPASGEDERKNGEAGALIYFHGGGYTVGSVDEFENGLRLLAEEAGVLVSMKYCCVHSVCLSISLYPLDGHYAYHTHQAYGIDYRLAPEFKFPTQLDEVSRIPRTACETYTNFILAHL